MKRLKVGWENVDKTNAILYPILIAIGLSVVAFIFFGSPPQVPYIWVFWSFFVLFILYGFALFLEPIFFIGKKKIFIPVWILWAAISTIADLIWIVLGGDFLTGIILIAVIWIFFLLGMIRIKYG